LENSLPLEQYGYNLTRLSQKRLFSPLPGYDAYIEHIFQILLKQKEVKNKYNPLILDLDETSRWKIIFEVIRRMAVGEAPGPLLNRQVIALNYKALLNNFPVSHVNDLSIVLRRAVLDENELDVPLAEPELKDILDKLVMKHFSRELWFASEERQSVDVVLSRLQALFLAVRQTEGNALLFINHFHLLLGGEQQYDPIDAGNLLKPILARHEIQLIGACTPVQYQRYIERDASISRRLQECYLIPDKVEKQ
jgi:ATP-dependent Clp protease ATP-binding subunit ClpA